MHLFMQWQGNMECEHEHKHKGRREHKPALSDCFEVHCMAILDPRSSQLHHFSYFQFQTIVFQGMFWKNEVNTSVNNSHFLTESQNTIFILREKL